MEALGAAQKDRTNKMDNKESRKGASPGNQSLKYRRILAADGQFGAFVSPGDRRSIVGN